MGILSVRTIQDRVLFRFPKQRELQFAAASILQEFVNTYDMRMRANTPVSPGASPKILFKLSYDVDISDEDWSFFQMIGLSLSHQRVAMDQRPDAVIDLSEERLVHFEGTAKHATQAMGVLSGVGCLPLPKIATIKPKSKGEPRWGWQAVQFISPRIDDEHSNLEPVANTDLLTAVDEGWTGFIMDRGWPSYLMASRGMPVIELIQPNEDRYWLSKWTNRAWRPVDLGCGRVEQHIQQAQKDLEEMIQCIAAAQDNAKHTTLMGASTSTVANAGNSLPKPLSK